jgi:hypothetical protein
VAGLCATGIELLLIFNESEAPNKYLSGHPFVPTIRIATAATEQQKYVLLKYLD